MKRLLVATVGDQANGLGHVSRELVLARELAKRGVEVWFKTECDTPGAKWIEQSGFPVLSYGQDEPAAHGILIDLEHGPSRDELEIARANYPCVIVVAGNGYTLKDYQAVRDLADLEIYQGLDEMPGGSRKVRCGVEHIIVDSRYRELRSNVAGHVVVNWGGSDPHFLSEPTLAALAGLDRQVVIVVGPARSPLVGEYRGVEIVHAPSNLLGVLNGAALFVGAFGTVVWEALTVGTPVVMMGWSTAHVEAQAQLQALGVGRNLGKWDEFDGVKLRHCVESFLAEQKLLPRYYKRARALVDGAGARRCADAVAGLLKG